MRRPRKLQNNVYNTCMFILFYACAFIFSTQVIAVVSIDLSTARPKWRFDGPALSGHLLYSLVNHAYGIRYHHHVVR